MNILSSFYLVGDLLILPLWLIMFLRNKKKVDMLLIGIIAGIVSIIYGQVFSNNDYWNPSYIIPNVPLEDFLYGLFFGGISAELYEFLFKRRNSLKRTHKTHIGIFVSFLLLPILLSTITVFVLHWNSIIALIVSPLISGLMIVYIRRDLLVPSVINAGLVTILTIICFNILLVIYPTLFTEYWSLGNLSGLSLINIPIEEIVFALCFGFSAGMLYEATFGYSEVKIGARNINRLKNYGS